MDGFRDIIPTAKIGHIGMYRDEETLAPHEYYARFPKDMERSIVIVTDPMLATGMSMEVGYLALLKHGKPQHAHLCCAIATPQSIDYMRNALNDSDDVTLWCAAVDPILNSKKYIVPGLGDAGDLCYGIKIHLSERDA